MQELLKLTANVLRVKPVLDHIKRGIINNKADALSRHFANYLAPVLVHDGETLEISRSIRHQVYCAEKQYLPLHPLMKEFDAMDDHSQHCLIQHKASKKYAGTIRIVYSQCPKQRLPIEMMSNDYFANCEVKPSDFPREQIGEVSRLAVSAAFRRRRSDKIEGAATGDFNQEIFSEKEMRCFPLLAVGLYLAAASICRYSNIEHVFAMMEPRLARSLTFLGFSVRQVGPEVEHHGVRALYYVATSEFFNTLPTGFRRLYEHLEQDLSTQTPPQQTRAV